MDQGMSFRLPADGPGQRVNTLLSMTRWMTAEKILPCLASNPRLNIGVIGRQQEIDNLEDDQEQAGLDISNGKRFTTWEDGFIRAQRAHRLARWADILLVVVDADTISAMLAGLGYSIALAILRCWDISKRIVMLPEMSVDQWKSPITRRQLAEIESKWQWIQVIAPALWDLKADGQQITDHTLDAVDAVLTWEGPQDAVEAVHSEAQKILQTERREVPALLEHATESHKVSTAKYAHQPERVGPRPVSVLPAEIWTIIFEFLDDWEYSTALGIHTTIATPSEWLPHIPSSLARPQSLEYTLLTASYSKICKALDTHSSTPSALSPLAVKVIFKFSLTPVLSHLATHQKDIFWTSFGLPQIPHQASTIYNNPTILEWWRTEPAILKKEYGPEAMDGASRAGFVDVLEWWVNSGLEIRYTEKALENASAKGHVHVLEWWKKTSRSRESSSNSNHYHHHRNHNQQQKPTPLPLKVGKSVLSAAQSGRTSVIKWWHESAGVAYGHEEGVARLASTYGHVDVLELWRRLKDRDGKKIVFDNQVLVGATRNGHADVLEWWKSRSGMVVEYKTCDIEEAMEDSLGGSRETEVRAWWEGNGLNLGVGTSEWMKVKTLGGL